MAMESSAVSKEHCPGFFVRLVLIMVHYSLADVLRDVERKDVTNVLEMHIFITQFFHKFDLRTTMLVSNFSF